MRKVIGLVLAALILAVLLPSVASAATSPQAEWYFAEGTTRLGFEEYLCIANLNQQAASVHVDLLCGTSGHVGAVLTIPPVCRATYGVKTAQIGPQDMSAQITSDVPVVVAERPMYFNYKGVWTGGSDAVGYPAQ